MKRRLDISKLYQGESQQPAWRRQTGQVEECVNFRLDPLEGARKRNPTDIHAEMGLTGAQTPYITTMRQFIIFIYDYAATGLGIVVFDRDTGGNVPVSAPNGWSYLNGASIDQVDTTSAIDTMIVLNRSVSPVTDPTPDYSIVDTVTVFSKLPTDAAPGTFYKVQLTENYDPPGYYLRVDESNPTVPAGFTLDRTALGWQRVPAPKDPDGHYRQVSMPHRLVYDSATNTFTFSKCPWKDRLTGNTNTNKRMPWVGDVIQSVCFHQGRLFFMGRNASVTAGASSPNQSVFNLFVDDINNVLDSDRVSIDILLPNIGRPFRCLSVGNDVFINCENGQLVFSSADQALTGTNGNYRQVGDFRSQDVPLGSNGSEITLVDQFGHVQLYRWVDVVSGVQYQGSLMDHVPTLLKNETVKRLFFINTSIFVTTASNMVYVHERFGVGGQVIQLAWSRYQFYEPTVFIDAWKNNLFLLQKGAWHTLLRYNHQKNTDSADDFQARLDRRQTATLTSGYDSERDRTAVTYLGRVPTLTTAQLVTADVRILSPVAVEGYIAYFPGNLVGTTCSWGFVYPSRIKLSKVFPASDMRPTLSRIVIGHKDSSNYNVTIGRTGGTQRTQSWNGPALYSYVLGAKVLDTGISKWVAQGDARTTDVLIECNNAGTVTVSFVEYQIQTGEN